MKKIIFISLVIFALVSSLTSCSLLVTQKINEDEKVKQEVNVEGIAELPKDEYEVVPPANASETALVEKGFEKVEKKETKERTIEELLQALHDGEPMTDSSGADYSTMPQTFSTDISEVAQLQGTTVQFSEEPWETEKTVEEFNMDELIAQMPPEERTEFEEMISMTEEDWEKMISEMEAEMNEMINSMDEESGGYEDDYNSEIPDMEDIQKQIDEAMQNLPEGYENLFPEGFDLSSILSGY